MTSFEDLKDLKRTANRLSMQIPILFKLLSEECSFRKIDTNRPGNEWFKCTHNLYISPLCITQSPCCEGNCPKLR